MNDLRWISEQKEKLRKLGWKSEDEGNVGRGEDKLILGTAQSVH